MIDVLVTCYLHTGKVSVFPEVRGHYLAHHLARSGLTAEFRQLPVPSLECKVLICSEYQQTMEWFDRHLAGPFSDIRADRMFCLTDHSLFGQLNHFSNEYCEWFCERGGVLVHCPNPQFLEGEHWIGLGVDANVVRPAADGRRNRVLFDFPKSKGRDTAATFDVKLLERLRKRLPGLRFVGTGSPDAPIREKFDEWIAYGQDHPSYVNRAFASSLAVIPGCDESMGLAMAEAQVAGGCIVSATYGPPDNMLVPEAAISCNRDIHSLAGALTEASTRDWRRIREAAIEKFDFAAVAARTRAAIGL
jgi:hypothetical protein